MKISRTILLVVLTLSIASCKKDRGVFTLHSDAVKSDVLSTDYQCETATNGVQASIPLNWTNVPDGTASMAIIMSNESNGDTYFNLWGIGTNITGLAHGVANDGPWLIGSNKDGTFMSYTSPCPPPGGSSTDTYTITLYALSAVPPSLPTVSSLSVDGAVLLASFDEVTILGTAEMSFTIE